MINVLLMDQEDKWTRAANPCDFIRVYCKNEVSSISIWYIENIIFMTQKHLYTIQLSCCNKHPGVMRWFSHLASWNFREDVFLYLLLWQLNRLSCRHPSSRGIAMFPRQSFWETRILTAGHAHLFPIVNFLSKAVALKFRVLWSPCIPKYVQGTLSLRKRRWGFSFRLSFKNGFHQLKKVWKTTDLRFN